MIIILFYFIIFLVSIIWSKNFQNFAIRQNLLDHPNSRSSHTQVKPRGGGIVFASLGLVWVLALTLVDIIPIQQTIILFPSALCIATLGYLDDQLKLAARWRFLIQLLAATSTAILLGGLSSINLAHFSIPLGIMGYILLIFVLLWSTNLFNFMDGIDGIASMEAVFVLGTGGFFLWQVGAMGLAFLSWGLIAGVLGFLCWNWPPSKIFMGDVGSTFLGFSIAAIALIGEIYYRLPLMLWLILYSVFWIDATLTLLHRILTRQKWYEGHCSHAYQRLHQLGWTHQRILFSIIFINLLLGCLAIFSFYHSGYILETLASVSFILGLLHWKIIFSYKKFCTLRKENPHHEMRVYTESSDSQVRSR